VLAVCLRHNFLPHKLKEKTDLAHKLYNILSLSYGSLSVVLLDRNSMYSVENILPSQ
jgi:hypothetical protein